MTFAQVFIIIIIIALIVLFYFIGSAISLWVQALVSGAKIGLLNIVFMRFRKIPPKLIVNSKIMAVKAGIDISSYRSKSMSAKLLNEADKIIVMTKDHELSVQDMIKTKNEHILVLGIPDPIGRGRQYYQEIFEMIKNKLEENLTWIVK